MKTALVQLSAGPDKEKNVQKALAFVQEAASQKAELIALPEMFSFRGNLRDKKTLAAVAEKTDGPTLKRFCVLAAQQRCWILAGSCVEKAAGEKTYNTSVLINPRGKVAVKYQKIHLFDAKLSDKIIKESDCFLPGRTARSVQAGLFRLGLSICYDVRFADLYARYAKQKTDVICVPSCFTRQTGKAHWEVLLRARAIENLAYVIAPNQVGKDFRGIEAHGHSMIVNPWGEIIACASGNKEEIVYGNLDSREINEARNKLPGII